MLKASLVNKKFRSAAHAIFSRSCNRLALPPADVASVNHLQHHTRVFRSLQKCIASGLTMSCPPPKSRRALQSMIERMSMSKLHFAAVEEIHLANHEVDDMALASLATMLPSLRTLTLFGASISQKGLELVFSECRNISRVFLFCCAVDTMGVLSAGVARLESLEKVFIVDTHPGKQQSNDVRPPRGVSVEVLEKHGLSACSECGCWFPLGSSAKTCLVHPGTYKGYGASCSSYDCCSSAEPGYPSSPGCVWETHKAATSADNYIDRPLRRLGGRLPLIEFYDVPFPNVKPLLWGKGFWLRDPRDTRFADFN